MTVRIELSDQQAAALRAQAEASGMTVENWLTSIAEELASAGSIAHLQRSDPEEWARQFRAWADGHDPAIPVLSDEAMRRNSIYSTED
jgi:hypothetical protein